MEWVARLDTPPCVGEELGETLVSFESPRDIRLFRLGSEATKLGGLVSLVGDVVCD